MKLKLLAAAIVALTLVIVAPLVAGASALQVGTIFPLTGPDQRTGLAMRNAVRLAVEEANAGGGVQGKAVKLVELDDASDPARAREAARQLASTPAVRAAVAFYEQGCSQACAPILDRGQLPYLLGGVNSLDVSLLGNTPTEFRVVPLGQAQMTPAARYAWEVLGARNFVYVHDDTVLGPAMVRAFRASLTPYFKHVVIDETPVHQKDPDFAKVIARARELSADYVFFGGDDELGARLLRALRAAGVKARFQMAGHWPSPRFIEAAGADAEGSLAAWHGLPAEETAEGRKFLETYRARFGDGDAGPYALFAYAETQVLLQAMESSFLTRPSIRGALANHTFDTVLGKIRFVPGSTSTYDREALYEVRGGKWVPFLVADAAGKLTAFNRQ